MEPINADTTAPNETFNNHTISKVRLIQIKANAPSVGKNIILSPGLCKESQYKNTMYELIAILLYIIAVKVPSAIQVNPK